MLNIGSRSDGWSDGIATVTTDLVEVGPTRVPINEILAVSKGSSGPLGVGCAIAPMMLGAMAGAGALASDGGERVGMFALAAVLLIVGVGYWRTLEVTYHVEIQTRAGTARVHSDTSEESIDQMIAAIQTARAGGDPRTVRVTPSEELPT